MNKFNFINRELIKVFFTFTSIKVLGNGNLEKLNKTYSILGYVRHERQLSNPYMHRKDDIDFEEAIYDLRMDSKFQHIYDLNFVRENHVIRKKEVDYISENSCPTTNPY